MIKYDNYLSRHLCQVNNVNSKTTKKQWIMYNYQKYLPSEKEAHILDIGPGFGELLDFLITDNKFCNVKAIDISDEVVLYCNSLFPYSTTKVNNTTNYLNKNKKKYKLVFMLQVLEHIPKNEIFEFLKSVRNCLCDDGVVIIEVPNISNIFVGVNSFYSDFTHEVSFTDTSLEYVLRESGFSVVEINNLLIPLYSFKRWVQYCLQKILNNGILIICNIYLPKKKQFLAPTIYAIAKK